VGSLERRLGRLEAERQRGETEISREALTYLSDEDLDALEDALEAGQEDGTATFEGLYRVVTERGRRALKNLLECIEALREGREPRASPEQTGPDHVELVERISSGDEEAWREWERRDGYRIWRYRK
jgi:DNA-binding FadR family transcriptional regulator